MRAPPRPDFFVSFLKTVKKLGATGILLEWEDMFPYNGTLRVLPAENHYTLEEVTTILTAANELDLDVIPLVQTFGHLEFALKNEEFKDVRAVPSEPQALEPSRPEALKLVKDMIDQVMTVHALFKPTHLHIGCDEVWYLKRETNGSAIFVDHVSSVADYVGQKHNVTPIIWDDMLREMPVEELKRLGPLVEPMVWSYHEYGVRDLPNVMWTRYAKNFKTFWAASAFKGADGPVALMPDVITRVRNHVQWLKVVERVRPEFSSFGGFALTGWSRYNHFAALCELLPTGIPSLALNLFILEAGRMDPTSCVRANKFLNCSVLAAENHYTLEEVTTILTAAYELDLDVIPLVQTFGHLEFALKNEEFKDLRAAPNEPQALEPSRPEAVKLVEDMIDQVMAVHAHFEPTHLHIGCDEVWYLKEHGNGSAIFLDHVTAVANHVVQKYNVTPIIWDDMLREMPAEELKRLGSLVEPMVWSYQESRVQNLSNAMWTSYAKNFKTFWIASAFKGADGPVALTPDLISRVSNHMEWLKVLQTVRPEFASFGGFALTGWSRYDHFAALCELLPVGIPSLALNLLVLDGGPIDSKLCIKAKKLLNCTVLKEFSYLRKYRFDDCNFPGSRVLQLVGNMEHLLKVHEYVVFSNKSKTEAWYSEYHSRHSFTSTIPFRKRENQWLLLKKKWEKLANEIAAELRALYGEPTAMEFLEQKIFPRWKALVDVLDLVARTREQRTWPRRPLPPSPEIRRFLNSSNILPPD
ncbi:unnamed protein product [Darwinula stevensoni]|uniref:beta-N-acetylhexosaminidase n=1 Tax=Darwinula stevensoni TaxID=69355 RepID=A0A7R8XD79_9CRUS|nr:unnamed protein product [Darwinula stevensoni]CAG0889564.1 unnamed protein product [Darwinula stevensoni]